MPQRGGSCRLSRHEKRAINAIDMGTAQQLDEFSLALHLRVAEMIERDSRLLVRAARNIEDIRRKRGDSVALREWENLVLAGDDAVILVLRERSEHAAELRKSSPFAGFLSQQERTEIFESIFGKK